MTAPVLHTTPGLKRKHFTILVYVLFSIYLLNGLLAIPKLSLTVDEGDHFLYGIRVLKGDTRKITSDDASVMPVSAFNAIPRAVEQVLNPGLQRKDNGLHDIMMGRIVTLLICTLTGWFVLRWSSEAFGPAAGLLSLFLFVFCPNLNSNQWLVSTDAFAALATIATAYFFYRFCRHSGWRNFFWFSCCLGLAQVSKQSLILLIPFFGLASLVVVVKRKTMLSSWRRHLFRLLVLGIVVCAVINLAFLFNGSFASLADYHFRSSFFQNMQQQWFSKIPVPLPKPFLEGFDGVKYMLSLGSGHEETSPRSYLFGDYFTGSGPWYYYPVVILFKTPLFTLLALIATVLFAVRKRFAGPRRHVILPLVLAVFFLVMVISLNTSQHSLRHLIMMYPLVYVVIGSLLLYLWNRIRWIILVGMVYILVSFYSFYPNIIAYTNELLWNKNDVYKVLASSNVNFGQAGFFLQDYLEKHPNVKIAGLEPAAGEFLIPVNRYLDLAGTGNYAWIRNFAPERHVYHCFLYIRVTEDDLRSKGLK